MSRLPRPLRPLLLTLLTLPLLLLPAGAPLGAQPTLELQASRYRPPQLVFESTPELAAQTERLRAIPAESYLPISVLLRLPDPGPPIVVHVVAEGSPQALLAPRWALAYAIGSAGLVVLIPSRVPSYPDGDLPGVLRHEVAHVLIARAAGRRPVPRFLDEGLALYAAREWRLEDRTRVFLAAWPLSGVRLAQLDQDFAGGADPAGRAYAISGAFVRYLVDEEGEGVVPRLLGDLARDIPFEQAFARQVGAPLALFEESFWDDLDLWQKWLPLISSSTMAWLLITLLALLAFKRRRERDEAQRRRWLLEEELAGPTIALVAPLADDEDEDEEPPPRETVH